MSKAVADVFGIKDRGSLVKGNFADIVIWEDDPLEPASMPLYVIIEGKQMDLITRSSRLKNRYIEKLIKN
jgi:imidazolonepropionase-like amidohydrolase